jgi:uncharacterized Zn finger protein
MDCPHCQTEMMPLSELINVQAANLPTVYWCLECGTLVYLEIDSQKIFIPELQKMEE